MCSGLKDECAIFFSSTVLQYSNIYIIRQLYSKGNTKNLMIFWHILFISFFSVFCHRKRRIQIMDLVTRKSTKGLNYFNSISVYTFTMLYNTLCYFFLPFVLYIQESKFDNHKRFLLSYIQIQHSRLIARSRSIDRSIDRERERLEKILKHLLDETYNFCMYFCTKNTIHT